MPTIKFVRDNVLHCGHSYTAGRVVVCDPLRAEHYVKSGAGVEVPAGTPDDPPPAAPHETAEAKPETEKATTRRK